MAKYNAIILQSVALLAVFALASTRTVIQQEGQNAKRGKQQQQQHNNGPDGLSNTQTQMQADGGSQNQQQIAAEGNYDAMANLGPEADDGSNTLPGLSPDNSQPQIPLPKAGRPGNSKAPKPQASLPISDDWSSAGSDSLPDKPLADAGSPPADDELGGLGQEGSGAAMPQVPSKGVSSGTVSKVPTKGIEQPSGASSGISPDSGAQGKVPPKDIEQPSGAQSGMPQGMVPAKGIEQPSGAPSGMSLDSGSQGKVPAKGIEKPSGASSGMSLDSGSQGKVPAKGIEKPSGTSLGMPLDSGSQGKVPVKGIEQPSGASSGSPVDSGSQSPPFPGPVAASTTQRPLRAKDPIFEDSSLASSKPMASEAAPPAAAAAPADEPIKPVSSKSFGSFFEGDEDVQQPSGGAEWKQPSPMQFQRKSPLSGAPKFSNDAFNYEDTASAQQAVPSKGPAAASGAAQPGTDTLKEFDDLFGSETVGDFEGAGAPGVASGATPPKQPEPASSASSMGSGLPTQAQGKSPAAVQKVPPKPVEKQQPAAGPSSDFYGSDDGFGASAVPAKSAVPASPPKAGLGKGPAKSSFSDYSEWDSTFPAEAPQAQQPDSDWSSFYGF